MPLYPSFVFLRFVNSFSGLFNTIFYPVVNSVSLRVSTVCPSFVSFSAACLLLEYKQYSSPIAYFVPVSGPTLFLLLGSPPNCNIPAQIRAT